MSFHPRAQVIPGLWIGSIKDASDLDFLRKENVRLIVNCTKNVPFYYDGASHARVDVDDNPNENERMLQKFPDIVMAIDKALMSGYSVLVHCFAGMQRSCAVATAYLMYLNARNGKNLPASRAMRFIKSRKSGAFEPVPTFEPALRAFEC